MERPLLVRPRVPEVTLPPPLRPLATGQVAVFNEAAEGTLNAADRNLKALLPLQLLGKVLGGNTGPRATVSGV